MYSKKTLFLFLFFIGFLVAYTQENVLIDSAFVAKTNAKTLVLKQKGKYKKAKKLNQWLVSKINKKDSIVQYAQTLHVKSRIEIDLGNYRQAIKTAKQALNKYKSIQDKEKIAAINNIIGVVYYLESKLDSSLVYYNRSFQQKKALHLEPTQLAISAYNLGIVYEDLANYNKAIYTYEEAVDYLLTLKEPKDAFLSDIYLAIANTYNHKNDLFKAKEYATLALQVGLEKYGKDHPNMSFVYESNASVYQSLGEYNKAKPFIINSLELRKKFYGDYHKWTVGAYANLAEILFQTNKIDTAFIVINKAINIEKKLNNNLDLADFYILKASILQKQKKYKKALKTIQLSSDFYQKVYGKKHKDVAATWLQKVKVYLELKDTLKATQAIKKVYDAASYVPKDIQQVQAPFIVLETLQHQFYIANRENKLLIIQNQMDLIEFIKNFYNTAESKLFFTNTTSKIIKEAVAYCYDEFKRTKDVTYKNKAFELIQLNTNSILAQELQENVYKTDNEASLSLLKPKNSNGLKQSKIYFTKKHQIILT